jgi:signal peptidase II
MVTEKADSLAKEDIKLMDSGIVWIFLSIICFVVDQATKHWVSNTFEYREVLEVLPVFNLTLAHNYGAAFSLLSNESGWQRWLFAGLAFVASVIILGWLRRTSKGLRTFCISLTLILGGALGNLYDRVTYGYVVDFLDFHWNGAHFPAFNVADSAITCGAVLMLWYSFFIEPKLGVPSTSEDKASK